MKQPEVTLTVLTVANNVRDRFMAVGRLSDAAARARTTSCPSQDKSGRRMAALQVATRSLQALKSAARVTILCNDQDTLRVFKRAAARSAGVVDGAAEYAVFVAAAEPHQIKYTFARGKDMLEAGSAAYLEGRRRLERFCEKEASAG